MTRKYRLTLEITTDGGSHLLEERICDPIFPMAEKLVTMAKFPNHIKRISLERVDETKQTNT